MPVPSETMQENLAWRTLNGVFNRPPTRMFALLLLLTAAPIGSAFSPLTALLNGDIWWHLRSGLWILQNLAVPRSGLFSQYADRPWVDCGWVFDIVAAGVYKLLGLRGFPALLMTFKLALAVLTFLLAGGRRGRFWPAVLLSATAQYVTVGMALRPNLFSVLFFGIVLFLLLQSRRSGDVHPLFWLPLLFFLWANLHGQVLIGLLLLGLFVAAEAAELLLRNFGVSSFRAPTHPVTKIFAIAALSGLATLLTPYSFRLFPSAFQTTYSKVLFEDFQEMEAMAFRRPEDFVLMLLVMAAFLLLGRQRSRDLFKVGVMGIFVMLAFRVQRDGWCVVLPAIAVIGDGLADWQRAPEPRNPIGPRWKWERPLLAVVVLAVFVAAVIHLPSSPALMNQASRAFPVKACDFIRTNQLPGPLFNTYYWGGFLIWYLPEYPVSIDSRLNLYGDEITDRYFKVSGGTQRLETDPSFAGARIILLDRGSGMLKALTTLPALRDQFRVAYEDGVAAVLVR